MIICSCILRFELIGVSSLKGRRSILNSLKEKLKKFNLSLLDISSEYPQEAELALVFLSPDKISAAQYREKIETLIERQFPQWPCEMEYEEL